MGGIWEISVAFGLIIICALISLWQSHDLHKDLLLASLRTLVQLILLGYILTWIFKNSSALLSLSMALVMTMNAAIHSRERIKSRYPGILLDNLLATTVTIWPLALLGPQLLHADPWWRVELFLPFLGMLLGSSMNGISLGVENFSHDVREKKDEVLSWIAMGATTKEATLPLFQRSLKIALTPILPMRRP